ncbi:hypothetical protein DDT91_18535 [Algoriphagus sp. AK58]|nr:hypothetical protein [Algoriphagus sp. AK58]
MSSSNPEKYFIANGGWKPEVRIFWFEELYLDSVNKIGTKASVFVLTDRNRLGDRFFDIAPIVQK